MTGKRGCTVWDPPWENRTPEPTSPVSFCRMDGLWTSERCLQPQGPGVMGVHDWNIWGGGGRVSDQITRFRPAGTTDAQSWRRWHKKAGPTRMRVSLLFTLRVGQNKSCVKLDPVSGCKKSTQWSYLPYPDKHLPSSHTRFPIA